MAASDASPFPVKNVAFRLTAPILDADGDPVTSMGTLTCETTGDGSVIATPPTPAQIGSTGFVTIDLTAAKMNYDTVTVSIHSSTTGAKDTMLVIHPMKIPDLAAVPAYGAGGMSLMDALGWLVALSRNKITQTSGTTTLFKDDGSTTTATATITDNGTTLTRAEFT